MPHPVFERFCLLKGSSTAALTSGFLIDDYVIPFSRKYFCIIFEVDSDTLSFVYIAVLFCTFSNTSITEEPV